MKGMMDLLEKAGLVRNEYSASDHDLIVAQAPELPVSSAPKTVEQVIPKLQELQREVAVSVEQIYSSAGVPTSPYPAERLLRLIDGLRVMDQTTRLQAIQAIDAADDSWTIQDSVKDASTKISVLEAHTKFIRDEIARAELETQTLLSEVRQRHEEAVAEIKRQIAELENLLAREISRSTQECSTLESALQSKKDDAQREISKLSHITNEFQGLITQFNLSLKQGE